MRIEEPKKLKTGSENIVKLSNDLNSFIVESRWSTKKRIDHPRNNYESEIYYKIEIRLYSLMFGTYPLANISRFHNKSLFTIFSLVTNSIIKSRFYCTFQSSSYVRSLYQQHLGLLFIKASDSFSKFLVQISMPTMPQHKQQYSLNPK